MPHKCTACGRQFADGSKQMLSGCPDCGGTKFQFLPAGGAPAAEEPPDPPGREAGTVAETVGTVTTKLRDFVGDDPGPPGRGDAGTQAPPDPAVADDPAATADAAGSPDAGRPADAAAAATTDGAADTEGEAGDAEPSVSPEDGAQSAARSEMVGPDELPGGQPSAGSAPPRAAPREGPVEAEPEGRVVDTPETETPDLQELREELNDQFEGIRICSPGEYELNLMELYEREETIVALQENGRYVIEPPESWHGD